MSTPQACLFCRKIECHSGSKCSCSVYLPPFLTYLKTSNVKYEGNFLREDFHCCQECGTRLEKTARLVHKLERKLLKIYTITFENLGKNKLIEGEDVLGKLRRQIVARFDPSPAFDSIFEAHPPQFDQMSDESQIDGARVKISDDGDDNDDDVVIMDEFKAEEMDQEESEINAYDVLTLVYGEESDVPLLRSDHEDVPPTKKETSPTPPSPKRILFEQTANKRRKVDVTLTIEKQDTKLINVDASTPQNSDFNGSRSSAMPLHPKEHHFRSKFAASLAMSQRHYNDPKTSHSKENHFRCHQCGKECNSRGALRNHISLHNADPRPFKCDECGKAVRQKSNLIKHKEMVHLKRKPITCPECGKKFGQKCNMVSHLNGVHYRIMHPCLYCEKSFASKSGLTQHVRKKHGPQNRPVLDLLTEPSF